MRDRNLEKNIVRVETFVEQWRQLSQFLDRGFKGGNFTQEEEGAFLDLKSEIAQQHEFLVTTVGGDIPHEDKTGRLLNSLPSMAGFKDLPEGMAKKVASEWHSTYLAMQGLLGRLNGRKAQMAGMSSLRQGTMSVLANPLVILLLAVAAGYGVYKFCDDVAPNLTKYWEN